MNAPDVTLVYAGLRYPISAETGDRILEFAADTAQNFLSSQPFVVPTIDRRQVIVNLGPSIPYAIEVGAAAAGDRSERPAEDRVRMLVAEQDVVPDVRL